MEFCFTRKPKTISVEECKEASEFYASLLMSSRLVKNLRVDFEFKKGYEKETGYRGTTEPLSTDFFFYPRDFGIIIDSKLSRIAVLRILAHEWVHIKQFATNELYEYSKGNDIHRWRGRKYNAKNIDYWDQPWEIDAYGREEELYFKYLKERRKARRKKK